MNPALDLYGSSIGKKIVMGVSGLMLLGFVVAHMVGNLKIYQGEPKYNAYAEFLREVGAPAFGHGQLLWLARFGLLAAVLVHLFAAAGLWRTGRAARRKGYRKNNDLSFSYASRTMRWGGVIVAAFVIYHLLHLTFGTVHADFRPDSVYRNVVTAFSRWPVALGYVACMIPLGLHIYHGTWSVTQTLGLDGPAIAPFRRAAAAAIALVVTLGNISIPVAVLAGWVG